MSLSLIPILIEPKKRTQNEINVIQMPDYLFKQLQINKREIKISIGRISIPVIVQSADLPENTIHVSEELMESFYLPIQHLKMQAMFLPGLLTLKLGPVIALLTDSIGARNDNEAIFRSIHLFCEEINQGVREKGGLFYIFSFDQFLKQGYFLENEKWVKAHLPAPDVIYNRIHSRVLEFKNEYKQFRQNIKQLSIPFFNDRFLSKWEVYNCLKETQLDFYIPETKLFSQDHFYQMAEKYETLFLKPIHGSQGRNIIKVKRESTRRYSLETSLKSLPSGNGEKFSFDELYQLVKPLIHNRIYIIQQGIPLMSHQSAAMDFRVLCHQNAYNHWKVTSTVARIAAKQEFVSNLARGGTLTRPLNALRTTFNEEKAIEALALMKELALETAGIISQNSQGLFGELGIDIGVDQEGKPWLIEVNSKPSKNFEDGLTKIRPSAKAIIQLCTILTFDSADMKEDL